MLDRYRSTARNFFACCLLHMAATAVAGYDQFAAGGGGRGGGGGGLNPMAAGTPGISYAADEAYTVSYPKPKEAAWNVPDRFGLPYYDPTEAQRIMAARAAMSLTRPEEGGSFAGRAAFPASSYEARILSNNPPAIGTINQGGSVNDLGHLFGNTQQLGQTNTIDGGLGNAEIPRFEPSLSDEKKDDYRKLTDVFYQYMRLDPNLYTGEGGLLPYKVTNDQSVVFDTWEFKASFAQPTAELGPTRYLSHKKKRQQWSFIRYGIGIRNTLDFMNSPEGRTIYYEQLKQIFATVQETNSYSVLHALLVTSGTIDRLLVRKFRTFRDNAKELLLIQEEVDNWGIFMAKMGLEKLDSRVSARFTGFGGQATTWLVTEKASVHMALEHDDRTNAAYAGLDLAISARQDSVNAIRTWGRGKVVIVRTFNLDKSVTPNPFQFYAMIGEHYNMSDPYLGLYKAADYESINMAIEIYNESKDAWARITLEHAVKNCGLFDKATGLYSGKIKKYPKELPRYRVVDDEGYPVGITDQFGQPFVTMEHFLLNAVRDDPAAAKIFADSFTTYLDTIAPESTSAGTTSRTALNTQQNLILDTTTGGAGVTTATTYKTLYGVSTGTPKSQKQIYEDYVKAKGGPATPPTLASSLDIYKTVLVTRNNILALIRANVRLPFSFTLFRPHMEYITDCAVKMLPGSKTGNTWVKPGMFTASTDGVVQEYMGSFTYHAKAIVHEPKNVCVIYNAFVTGYEGGCNDVFIPVPEKLSDYDPSVRRFGANDPYVRDTTGKRQPSGKDRPSIICMMQPLAWVNGVGQNNPLSLHGVIGVDYGMNRPSLALDGSQGLEYASPSWELYNKLYKFLDVIKTSPDASGSNVVTVNDLRKGCAVTHRGHTRHYDRKGTKFGGKGFEDLGTGHWGATGTYIGCNKFRSGDTSKIMGNPTEIAVA